MKEVLQEKKNKWSSSLQMKSLDAPLLLQTWFADEEWSIASAHRGASIPGFAGLCLHATPPPDTKARTSSASPIPKCQKQYIATVAQVLKFSPSTKIQAIIPGADLYLNNSQ
ncbi:hypothetical protein Tco_0001277 [Tanacetum coccineum]